MEKSKSAPTGCYKCGLPGHWSRDCPNSSQNPNPNPNSSNPNSLPNSSSTFNHPRPKLSAPKPPKEKRSRPKLTPEKLVSDDAGLSYILRYFPSNFKYHGRGHEVNDLGRLLSLYSDWHKRLLPYYSFDEFVHKVEKAASTKRVKTCIRDLREKVARGDNPAKLHESQTENVDPPVEQEQDPADTMNFEGQGQEDRPSIEDHMMDDLQESMLQEIYDKATEEPSQVPHKEDLSHQNNEVNISNEPQLTDEQRARIEANRKKALERAAEVQMTEEQRARMEANRLKALERAAARAQTLQNS